MVVLENYGARSIEETVFSVADLNVRPQPIGSENRQDEIDSMGTE